MRITGRELRQIIKEELRRVMREDDTVVNIPTTEDYKFTAKAVLSQGTMPSGTGKEFTGKLFFDSSVGVAEKFVSDRGLTFRIEPIASSDKTGLSGDQTQANLKGKSADAKMVFTDRMTATVSYTY